MSRLPYVYVDLIIIHSRNFVKLSNIVWPFLVCHLRPPLGIQQVYHQPH